MGLFEGCVSLNIYRKHHVHVEWEPSSCALTYMYIEIELNGFKGRSKAHDYNVS